MECLLTYNQAKDTTAEDIQPESTGLPLSYQSQTASVLQTPSPSEYEYEPEMNTTYDEALELDLNDTSSEPTHYAQDLQMEAFNSTQDDYETGDVSAQNQTALNSTTEAYPTQEQSLLALNQTAANETYTKNDTQEASQMATPFSLNQTDGNATYSESNAQDTTPLNTTAEVKEQQSPNVTYIPPLFEKFVPVPCFEQPKPEQPIVLQNNGFCLSAVNTTNTLSVQVTSLTQVTPTFQQQAWFMRPNGVIMNKEFDKCLFRQQEGTLGLCGCEEAKVSEFDMDFTKGLLLERNSKQLLSIEDQSVTFKAHSESTAPDAQRGERWTTYELVSREQNKEPTLVKVQPRSSDVLSIQQLGLCLVVQQSEQQTLSLRVSKQPPGLQFQSWMFLPNGKIKNVQFNQCLSIRESGLGLASCESEACSTWDFNQELGSMKEQKLNQCLSLDQNDVALKPCSLESDKSQQKWGTYTTSKLTSREVSDSSTSSAAMLKNHITSIAAVAVALFLQL
jgi:hypothetical protein